MFSTHSYLKFTSAAAAIMLIMTASDAEATTLTTLDISGLEVNGGSTTTRTLSVGSGRLQSIDFDFDVEHFSPSWGSETNIEIVAPDTTTFTYNGGSDFGFSTGSGTSSFSGSFFENLASTLGMWTFNFTDTFNDGLTPDHRYLDGSTITVSAVPLPAGFLLGLTGLASFGALGLRRRRKSLPV